MKKLLIIDPLSLHDKNDIIIGHSMQLTKNYFQLFSEYFEVKVAGKFEYEQQFQKSFVKLPFSLRFGNANFLSRVLDKFKIAINIIRALHYESDYYILYPCSYISLLISLPFLPKKKLFIIDYKISSRNFHNLFHRKISGVLTSQPSNRYGLIDSFLMKDYYYNPASYDVKKSEKLYDFSCVGNISKGKLIEDVVAKFQHTDYKIIISGIFEDKNRLKKIQDLATNNIIINDGFISESEYNRIIKESIYLILPYNKNYDSHTSGVVYDAIFNRTPIIGTNVSALNIVKEHNMGICYNSILDININDLNENHSNFLVNIDNYISNDRAGFHKLVNFILSK